MGTGVVASDCAGITGELLSPAATVEGAGVNAGIDNAGLALRAALEAFVIGFGFAGPESAMAGAGSSVTATGRSGIFGVGGGRDCTIFAGALPAGSVLAGGGGSTAGCACTAEGSGAASWAKAGVAVKASTAAIAVRPG